MNVDSGNVGGSGVPCAACDGRAAADSPLFVHHAHHNDETYTLQNCPTCHLKFWWPLRADPSVYADEGFEAYVDYHAGTRPFPRWAEPLFRNLPEPAGRALDVGCGDGAVLRRLSESGFKPHGLDLDQKSVAIARDKYGLENVSAKTLDEFESECLGQNRRFDLITFFEVLEHQDSPRSFLAQVMRLGRPGGLVAGSVPNRNRFLARLDRKLSDGDLPPHHFLWFSADALEQLLRRSGFVDVQILPTGALPYREIVAKLIGIAERKTAKAPLAVKWIRYPLMLAAPLVALGTWIGMRVSPSHLFFRCSVPAIDTKKSAR